MSVATRVGDAPVLNGVADMGTVITRAMFLIQREMQSSTLESEY